MYTGAPQLGNSWVGIVVWFAVVHCEKSDSSYRGFWCLMTWWGEITFAITKIWFRWISLPRACLQRKDVCFDGENGDTDVRGPTWFAWNETRWGVKYQLEMLEPWLTILKFFAALTARNGKLAFVNVSELRRVSGKLELVNLSVNKHSSLREKLICPELAHLCERLCVWVCKFSSFECQCKVSLPCNNAKRVLELKLIPLSRQQSFPSLPLPPSLRQSEELKRCENKWTFFFFLHSTPLLFLLFLFPPPLCPVSRWSTPSCLLLRSGLLLR